MRKLKLSAIGVLVVSSAVATAQGTQQQTAYFYVPSRSMEPTLALGLVVKIKNNPYQSPTQVQRGDVVVFTPSSRPAGPVIKRIMGVPGDRVRLSGTSIWVNGKQLQHTRLGHSPTYSTFEESNTGIAYQVQYERKPRSPAEPDTTVVVPQGKFFVLGDNRNNSHDSRYIGMVPFSVITGKQID